MLVSLTVTGGWLKKLVAEQEPGYGGGRQDSSGRSDMGHGLGSCSPRVFQAEQVLGPERVGRRFLILPEALEVWGSSPGVLSLGPSQKCTWNGFNKYFPGHLPCVRHSSRNWGHRSEPSSWALALLGLTPQG